MSAGSPAATADATPLEQLASARFERDPRTIALVANTLRLHVWELLAALLIIAAGALWITTLAGIDALRINDLGLVSVLPPAGFVALGMACASFALTLRREQVSTPLALMNIAVLILMLHGATPVLDSEPAFNVVWRHAGVTDFVLSKGTVDPDIDAYFNWPGFFFLSALATHAAGVQSALGISSWAPVAFELLYLPGLVVIARAFTDDRRLAWSATWIFYATNWVGQDYLSPQAMAYVLYLAVIAAALTCLARRTAPDLPRLRHGGQRLLSLIHLRRPGVAIDEARVAGFTPSQRAVVVLVCALLFAATVASHQLTPWMMLAGITALICARRCTATGLPTIMLLLLGAWLTYMAAGYLDGHLKPLLGQALDVDQSVSANVGGRLQGSPEHLLIVRLRLGMTALLWTLAVAGGIRSMRRGHAHPSHALLAVAPVGMVALQPYGGEMLLRVYLFSLPFTACFAAAALMPSAGAWRGWRGPVTVVAAGALLLGGFVFTRYGNERASLYTHAEVQAVDRLYEIAPRGSLLLAAGGNLPWKDRYYGEYKYQLVGRQLEALEATATPPRSSGLAEDVAHLMGSHPDGSAFLIITRSQRVYEQMLGVQPWGSSSELLRAVEASPAYAKVFDNGDGKIFVLRAARETG